MFKEEYRSGHNGADSKSDGRLKPAQEFDSPLFRLRSAEADLRRDEIRQKNATAGKNHSKEWFFVLKIFNYS